MTETFTSPMPPSIKEYTRELVTELNHLAELYARPDRVGEYMGIREAIKYIQDTSRRYS